MKLLPRALAPIAMAWLGLGQSAARGPEAAWPRLEGEARPECEQALQLGRRAFASRAFAVSEPQRAPERFGSTPALWPPVPEMSEGYAVSADPRAFDRLGAGEDTLYSLYWQKRPTGGYRLALLEDGYGWRGETFTLYALDPALTPAAVLERIKAHEQPAGARVIVERAWLAPRLYRLGADGPEWALTVGEAGVFLDAWQVLVPATDGLRPACVVRFRPAVAHAADLLPGPVRDLEVMLDRTMGSGRGEGSLHPTGRMREQVEQAWANAMLRPWASTRPYNSRAVVEAGLSAWAAGGAQNRALLKAIRRQYPRAEEALAGHYRARFGLAPQAARRQAGYVLDIAFRLHYTFPGATGGRADAATEADANPWPLP